MAATLSAAIICGGANNQLAHAGVEKLLADRGILYAPDYVVNAGGVIQVADERAGFSFERAKARAEQIFATTTHIFEIAEADGVPSSSRGRPARGAENVRCRKAPWHLARRLRRGTAHSGPERDKDAGRPDGPGSSSA